MSADGERLNCGDPAFLLMITTCGGKSNNPDRKQVFVRGEIVSEGEREREHGPLETRIPRESKQRKLGHVVGWHRGSYWRKKDRGSTYYPEREARSTVYVASKATKTGLRGGYQTPDKKVRKQ